MNGREWPKKVIVQGGIEKAEEAGQLNKNRLETGSELQLSREREHKTIVGKWPNEGKRTTRSYHIVIMLVGMGSAESTTKHVVISGSRRWLRGWEARESTCGFVGWSKVPSPD